MRRLAFAVVLLASLAGSARADVTTYTDSAAFFAALGSTPFTTETYEGPAANTLLGAMGSNTGSLNGLNYLFSSPTFGGSQGQGRIDNIYNSFGSQSLAIWRANPVGAEGGNPNASYFYPGESVTISRQNNGPIYAIGAFFNGSTNGPGATIPGDFFIQTPVGTAFNANNPVLGNGGPNPSMFFVGLISSTPFNSATLGFTFREAANGGNIDNLTLTGQPVVGAAVPEPATLLVLSGLLAVGGGVTARRRRGATVA
jgi:hypothetical protein